MGRKSSKLFVGMDVHKESIDITLAEEGGEVRHYGRIGGEQSALIRTVRKLESLGKSLVFVYEAGPCGFWIYRLLGNAVTSAGWSHRRTRRGGYAIGSRPTGAIV